MYFVTPLTSRFSIMVVPRFLDFRHEQAGAFEIVTEHLPCNILFIRQKHPDRQLDFLVHAFAGTCVVVLKAGLTVPVPVGGALGRSVDDFSDGDDRSSVDLGLRRKLGDDCIRLGEGVRADLAQPSYIV